MKMNSSSVIASRGRIFTIAADTFVCSWKPDVSGLFDSVLMDARLKAIQESRKDYQVTGVSTIRKTTVDWYFHQFYYLYEAEDNITHRYTVPHKLIYVPLTSYNGFFVEHRYKSNIVAWK